MTSDEQARVAVERNSRCAYSFIDMCVASQAFRRGDGCFDAFKDARAEFLDAFECLTEAESAGAEWMLDAITQAEPEPLALRERRLTRDAAPGDGGTQREEAG